MKKTSWSNLDHKIWKLRAEWPLFQKIQVALSGGVDSLVLLSVFHRLSRPGNFQVIATTIHHGPGPQESWRDEALRLCEETCRSWGVPFFAGGPSPTLLSSEAELREFRYQELRRIATKEQCDFILTAHHAEDLLETRFLRLLRGTGPQGLAALLPMENNLWRPFLNVSRRELVAYAEANGLKFLEDPSNLSLDPLRNWVRHEIFPSLEARQPGMVRNLGRSLQLLVEALESASDWPLSPVEGGLSISREFYLSLSVRDQRRLLAAILHRLGIDSYSQGQIEEIHKRLDKTQKVHTFSFGSLLWTVDAKQVRATNQILNL